jgi:hypothetical protein
MKANYVDAVLKKLREKGITIGPGLTDEEVNAIENDCSFRFPLDLRQFLQCGLPVSPQFPNWRAGTRDDIQSRLNWPTDGILFDIEHNSFWLSDWGQRPIDLSDAKRFATDKIRQAPVLVPVYGHRYLPSEPTLPGNPVYSVYQTDIIYYGFNLPDYFRREFNVSRPQLHASIPREIRFWYGLVS